jgi:hypothetical protein
MRTEQDDTGCKKHPEVKNCKAGVHGKHHAWHSSNAENPTESVAVEDRDAAAKAGCIITTAGSSP